jgi:outer membrane cobalamin receptor
VLSFVSTGCGIEAQLFMRGVKSSQVLSLAISNNGAADKASLADWA